MGNPLETSSAPIQWGDVSTPEVDEVKFNFDVLGDQFTGIYLGQRTSQNERGSYLQYRFEGEDGITYFINGNFNLTNSMKNVRINQLTRITWVDEKDTGQATPMRIFKVEVGRRMNPKAPPAKQK